MKGLNMYDVVAINDGVVFVMDTFNTLAEAEAYLTVCEANDATAEFDIFG